MADAKKEKKDLPVNMGAIIRKTKSEGISFLNDNEITALLKSKAAKEQGVSIDATRLKMDDWLANQGTVVNAVLVGFNSFQDEIGKTVLGVLFYSDFNGKNELYECSLTGLTSKLRGKAKGLYSFECIGVSASGGVEFKIKELQKFV